MSRLYNSIYTDTVLKKYDLKEIIKNRGKKTIQQTLEDLVKNMTQEELKILDPKQEGLRVCVNKLRSRWDTLCTQMRRSQARNKLKSKEKQVIDPAEDFLGYLGIDI